MKRFFLIFSLIIFLSGCFAGTPFKWDNARQLKKGMTTEEVYQIMGTPYRVVATDDIVRCVWVYVDGITFANKSLSIDFKDGKVAQVPPIPEGFKD